MKSFDYEAVVLDGTTVLCLDCLTVDVEDDRVSPIFADSEWDYYPVCEGCGEKLDYMSLTDYGREQYEIDEEQIEQIEQEGREKKKINTVKIWRSAIDALGDAEKRSWKAKWFSASSNCFAVGDLSLIHI